MKFNQFADKYDQYSEIQKDLIRWGCPILSQIDYSNKIVLELGAGTGCLTKELLSYHPLKLIASDLSENMLHIGTLKYPEATWESADAWDLNGYQADIITSSSLLHWAPNPISVLKGWHKNLKNGGLIQALFYIDGNLKEMRLFDFFFERLIWHPMNTWIHFFKNAGFKLIMVKSLRKKYFYRTALQLFKSLKYSGGCRNNSLSFKYLKDMVTTYNETYNTPQGVQSTWHFGQIIAKKIE